MVEKYSILVDDTENEEMLWHPSIEIAFVLNGYGVLFIDGERYEIQEEDMFVINSYQIHRVELKEGSHLLSVLIAPGFARQFFPQIEEYTYELRSFLCAEELKPAVTQLKKQLARTISVWSKSREEFSELRMNIQLSHLIECLSGNFGKKIEKSDKKEERWLDLVRYLNESYQEDITLKMLAKRKYMSQSYLSRMFQKEMGVTFTEYITEIRLSHALNLLANKELTVTDVCFEAGFRNVNSFIESFKQKYGKTPGQYRKEIKEQPVPQKVLQLEDGMEFSALFAPLMKYIEEEETETKDTSSIEVQMVKIQSQQEKERIKPVWKQLLNVGYARDIMNAEIQKQIKRACQDIGFKYLRFHGILDDDMVLYRELPDGTPVFNYHYVDQILDFILEEKMHPYIEFGYVPKALAESPECSPFFRSSIISFPNNMEKWKLLLNSLMDHWQLRYGREEMKRWIFSPLFQADLLFFFQEEQKERYQEWYEISWRCIKEHGQDYCVAAPLRTTQGIEEADLFLDWCEKKDCMPELLSLTCFHTAELEEEERNIKLIEREDVFPMAVSRDRNYLSSLKRKLLPLLERHGIEPDRVLLAEWNSNLWQRDLANDTCYKSAFFFKNILENLQNYSAFGYWTLSDFMEELPPAEDLFHGGFGLFTTCGIPKSGYQALCLLNHLGDFVVAQGEGYLVTKKEDELQVFFYNYCHYETLYRYRHATNLSRTTRYQVFCQEREKQFELKIQGLKPGNYRIERYEISRAHGSAYDAWVEMGAPASVTPYERKYLEQKSGPGYRMELCTCGQELNLTETVGEHEVKLLLIKYK